MSCSGERINPGRLSSFIYINVKCVYAKEQKTGYVQKMKSLEKALERGIDKRIARISL